MNFAKSDVDRFHAGYVPVTESGCWLWVKYGVLYGYMYFRGVQTGAHRVSWVLHNGEIPPGLVVRHKCDTPRCVNPSHLELGTVKDNAEDMVKRGGNRDSVNARKPAPDDVIRQIFHDDRPIRSLASVYGLHPNTILHIKTGAKWGSVTGKEFSPRQTMKGEYHPNAKLSNEQVIDIINSPMRGTDLARKYVVSASTISMIRSGIRRKPNQEPQP